MEDAAKLFAQRLTAARMRRGWGPRELAKEALTYSSFISLYESGRRLPTLSELGALADALGVRPDDLWPGLLSIADDVIE
jgi:transcriptional regulator with XRE-family HTH domain